MKRPKKRIIILGPIVTPTYFGGVATFDEGLAISLSQLECDVILATNQKDATDYIQDLPIKKITRSSFRKLVKEFQPDYIISELGYAKYYVLNKCDAKKIYYLHAYFKRSYYGALKSKIAVLYQKLLIKFSDIVISNSHFTAMINRDFFGIDSDAVCEVGLKDEFCDAVSRHSSISREERSIFFAARLVPAKGVKLVVEAVRLLSEQNKEYHLYIAGDGPEKEHLLNTIDKLNLPITYLGRLTQNQMVEQYLKSDVFISLDSSEPYGIVFLEAMVSGCKIVCPITGGQIEVLKDFREYVSYVDVGDITSIAAGIDEALNNNTRPQLSQHQKKSFTYRASAIKLLKILENLGK